MGEKSDALYKEKATLGHHRRQESPESLQGAGLDTERAKTVGQKNVWIKTTFTEPVTLSDFI